MRMWHGHRLFDGSSSPSTSAKASSDPVAQAKNKKPDHACVGAGAAPAAVHARAVGMCSILTVCPGLRDGYVGGGQFGRFGGGGALDLGLEMLGLLAVGREGAVELGSLAGEGRELAGHLRGV